MFRVKKAAPASMIRKAKKSQAGKDALTKLNDYLNANTAEPMYWLHNLFTNQQNAITYKELREAILNGYMDEATLRAWQHDYAMFVTKRLDPIWRQAAQAGAAAIHAGKDWIFDAGGIGMSNWIAKHGGQFITGLTEETRHAVQSMIAASTSGQYTVDELSRLIRPLIGLNEPQAKANMRYYETVKSNLLENNPNMREATAERRAREAALKYQERQLRQRAQMIAETELAAAYCAGNREYVREAQAKGLMGPGVYVWDTAADEAVCSICGGLNGAKTDDRGQYYVHGAPMRFRYGYHPPAHPRCRCGEHFEETEPPAAPRHETVDHYKTIPRSQAEAELGGEDGGKQRAAVINSSVITDDVDLDKFYHARIVADHDDAAYRITLRVETTLKSLTELADSGIITVSNEALVHSSIGEYTETNRLKSGCHSQAGIEELTRRGIEYNIVKTASNGVRLGEVPTHKKAFKQKLSGPGTGQAWFPVEWDDDMIMEAGTAVANSSVPLQDGHYKVAEYNGVMVRVLFKPDGSIESVCPDYDQDAIKGVIWYD